MTNDRHGVGVNPESNDAQVKEGGATPNGAKVPSVSYLNLPRSSVPPPPKELSAEEQMALYEKELKENDWGHQPC